MSEPRGRESIWVVDRIEGDLVSLVEDETRAVSNVARRELPQRVREGDVLRVPVGAGGPEWERAVADERLEQERLDEARATLDRLRRRDPGGDVKL